MLVATYIPKDAQNHLVRGENTGIHIAYNQSFFSIGSAISSALSKSTKGGIAKFIQTKHLTGVLPHLSGNMPHVKISVLLNPNLSYEFFLRAVFGRCGCYIYCAVWLPTPLDKNFMNTTCT